LRLVAGLEKPDAGIITIDGRDATAEPPALRDVSFVFQQYSLYPHLTVYDNLAFPLRAPARRVDEAEIRTRVERVAQLVRIDHKLSNSATRLSGGEMQRVAIGRALVRRPAIYLMDEPLSSLDAKLRAELRVELKHIQADLGATMLYVTHDQTEAMTMASRIGILQEGAIGAGRHAARNLRAAGQCLRRGAAGLAGHQHAADRCASGEGRADGAVSVGARTEHVELTPADDGPAEVIMVEHLGSENFLHLRMDGHRLVTLTSPDRQWRPGRRARVSLHQPLYFDAAGCTLAAALQVNP
jgi:multiple sugar transport system ATP-binding protein